MVLVTKTTTESSYRNGKRVLDGNGLGPLDSTLGFWQTIPEKFHQWLWVGEGLSVRSPGPLSPRGNHPAQPHADSWPCTSRTPHSCSGEPHAKVFQPQGPQRSHKGFSKVRRAGWGGRGWPGTGCQVGERACTRRAVARQAFSSCPWFPNEHVQQPVDR